MELKKKIRDQRQRLLLLLAREGSEPAFQQLYRQVYPPVAAYVRKRVPNSQDADDVISEVFRKFLQGLDGFNSERGSVLTWVVSMARHGVIDYQRKRRPVMVDCDELAGVLAGDRPEALQRLIKRDDLRRVQALLLRQPPEIREMFDLRFGRGLRVSQVAAVMEISGDAAKQRFARVLKQLRAELRDEERISGNRKGESPWAVTD